MQANRGGMRLMLLGRSSIASALGIGTLAALGRSLALTYRPASAQGAQKTGIAFQRIYHKARNFRIPFTLDSGHQGPRQGAAPAGF